MSWPSRLRNETTSAVLKGASWIGWYTGHETAMATVNAPRVPRAKDGFASVAVNQFHAPAEPTMGSAIRLAQKLKRSKVRMSKGLRTFAPVTRVHHSGQMRQKIIRGSGVVPPRAKIMVSQKPKNSGRSLVSFKPLMKMKGSASSSAPREQECNSPPASPGRRSFRGCRAEWASA